MRKYLTLTLIVLIAAITYLVAQPINTTTSTGAWGLQGANKKALTAASATNFVQVKIPTSAGVSGVCTYEIFASDGTDFQSRSGALYFSAVNKAGTETCLPFRADGGTTVDNTTDGVAASSGTLTNTFTCITTPTNGIGLSATAASSLTETTLDIYYQCNITSGTAEVLPQ